MHEIEHHLGPIEILVTNTGGPPTSPDPLSFSPEEWRAAFDQLVLGPLAFVEATLPAIGRAFGRNHTTVLHACRRTAERIAADREAYDAVHRLTRDLSA